MRSVKRGQTVRIRRPWSRTRGMRGAPCAAATTNWNSGAGFAPIGENSGAQFQGCFNGNGRVIRNLRIVRPTQAFTGFFGAVGSGGAVNDLGLEGGTVTGDGAGGLVGNNNGTLQ